MMHNLAASLSIDRRGASTRISEKRKKGVLFVNSPFVLFSIKPRKYPLERCTYVRRRWRETKPLLPYIVRQLPYPVRGSGMVGLLARTFFRQMPQKSSPPQQMRPTERAAITENVSCSGCGERGKTIKHAICSGGGGGGAP